MAEIELPPDTLPKLREASGQIKTLQNFITRAKVAGIPVERQETRLKELKAQMNKVRDGFYPNETL